MRVGRLLLAGLVAALSWVLLAPATAYACSCAGASTAGYVDHADLVVTGTVTARRDAAHGPVLSSGRPVSYEIAVNRVYKGNAGPRIEVTTAAEGASCGLEVTEGERYLFFADQGEEGLRAGLCGGTTAYTAAEERAVVRILGTGAVPSGSAAAPSAGEQPAGNANLANDGPPAQWAVPAWALGGLVLVAAVGVGSVVVRRRG